MSKKTRRFLALIGPVFMLLSSHALAGTLNDIFGKGVFDTHWGMNIDEVRAIHPSGELQKFAGSYNYFIYDGRTLFGIKRDRDAFIGFIFDANDKLIKISAGMPAGLMDFEREENSITTAIGITPEAGISKQGLPLAKWFDGSGVEIVLMRTPGLSTQGIMLTIEKMPTPKETTKEALGF